MQEEDASDWNERCQVLAKMVFTLGPNVSFQKEKKRKKKKRKEISVFLQIVFNKIYHYSNQTGMMLQACSFTFNFNMELTCSYFFYLIFTLLLDAYKDSDSQGS